MGMLPMSFPLVGIVHDPSTTKSDVLGPATAQNHSDDPSAAYDPVDADELSPPVAAPDPSFGLLVRCPLNSEQTIDLNEKLLAHVAVMVTVPPAALARYHSSTLLLSSLPVPG